MDGPVAPSAFSPELLVQALAPFTEAPRVWVAFSGGLDSTCLLSAAAAVATRLPGPLCAVHLDHGLHPESSFWAQHCGAVCQALGVPLTILRLSITRGTGESLEAVAREARYAALAALLRPRELLLTAQHRDDQAETLLLALLRGSGPEGLAAMPRVCDLGAGQLVRPLLGVSRAALEGYARKLSLRWVEDPSNASHSIDRNFLRHRVLPLVRTRWPEASATLARSAGHCAEAAGLVEAQAAQVLSSLGGTRPGALSIPALARLDPPLARAVLRLWLRRRGMPMPDTRHLGRILSEVLPARRDANPLVAWSGCEIRRYRGDLLAMTPLPPRPGAQSLAWREDVLTLPAPLGTLTRRSPFSRAQGRAAGHLAVRFGIEGQWCRPRPGGHRRSLKKLFQEAAIPPWLRPYVPLVFAGGDLVAIAGVCPCMAGSEPDLDDPGIGWSGHPWEGLGYFTGDG
jgi:tRNA(Ile)-lysidine synthase